MCRLPTANKIKDWKQQQEENDGEVWRWEGVRRGREQRRAEGKNNRRGKVPKSRANAKTLTVDINVDVPFLSRDLEKKKTPQPDVFFPLTGHQRCARFPRLIVQ